SDATQDQDHTIYLYGLDDATTYRYKVRSTDASGNTVESSLRYFTTSPPNDTTSPKASAPRHKKMDQPLFPLRFDVEAEDNFGLDRVAFSFDGQHFMTDYDAPFNCYVNPADVGLSYESYFGLNHTVLAEVYDQSENLAAVQTAWAEMPRCPEMELVVELGESTRVYTPHENINNYRGQIQIVARENIGLTWANPGEGPHPGVASTRWGQVDEVRVYFDDSLISTITPAVDETEFTCPLHVMYMAAPSTHEVKVEIQTSYCIMVRRATMRVIQQVTDLSVERSVTRDGTGFKVAMTLTNDGITSATLDYLTDEVEGFQITFQPSSLYDAAVSYNPTTRRSVIEYDFHCSVAGESSRTIRYTAIPILSEGVADYRLGMNNSLGYHDHFDRYYTGPTMDAVGMVDGQHINHAVDDACQESDYLIVTNPAVLLGIYDPVAANELLVKTAELANVRNGILGYFLGASSIHTSYRSNDKIGCGNIMFDWKDEIVLMNENEDEIQIYCPGSESFVGDEPWVISVPGLHPNDVLLVGNLLADSDPSHPEDEIAIIDGHSSGGLRGDVVLYNYRPDHGNFEQDTNNTTFNPSLGDQVIVGDMIYHDLPSNRDEIILFKGETGKVQAYYGNAAMHRQFDSIYQSGDLVAAGDVISSVGGDEIIIGDISAQQIVIYSGEGVILHQYGQSIQTHDTLQVSPEGLALADASAERMSLRGIDTGSDWDRGGFDVNFSRDDTFICGHVIEHDLTQYLFARGHRDEHFTKGDVEIFPYSHFSSGVAPGDREHLNDLLNSGGAWADQMGDNFKDSGYLLIVGETEIIPAFACSFYLAGNGRGYIEFTDNYYGNISGNMKKPEISVGRIIGNTIDVMITPIQTSLDIADGSTELNLAEAYCFSGGPEERHETTRHTVVEKLEDKGWHVSRNDEPSADTIYSNLTDIDALFMAGHGNWDHCWNVSGDNVRDRFVPGRTAPIIFAA
ncbi:MAG: hypothetical protein KAS23_09110, partial [Anaerohalosphaera sp.]|nr:hypothetical protein [Anaerohalosphaera sp.]